MAQQIAVAARTIVPSRMLRLLPRTPVCPTHVLGQPVVCVLCVCHLRIFFNHCHTVHCRTTVTNGPTTMFDNARSFGLFIVGDQAQCSLCRDRRVHKIHRVVRWKRSVYRFQRTRGSFARYTMEFRDEGWQRTRGVKKQVARKNDRDCRRSCSLAHASVVATQSRNTAVLFQRKCERNAKTRRDCGRRAVSLCVSSRAAQSLLPASADRRPTISFAPRSPRQRTDRFDAACRARFELSPATHARTTAAPRFNQPPSTTGTIVWQRNLTNEQRQSGRKTVSVNIEPRRHRRPVRSFRRARRVHLDQGRSRKFERGRARHSQGRRKHSKTLATDSG